MTDKNKDAFLALVRAGLWEKEAQLLSFKNIDFKAICRLAEEQSVVGLVAAGVEHVTDVKVPKDDVLTLVGSALQIEQRNLAMNNFIGVIVERMREADIYTLLVKGQGIAQCYERPLWRVSGDVDFLLSESNYEKAKVLLLPLSSSNKNEEQYSIHLGMSIDPWYVEIHGTMRTGLSSRVDKVIDKTQNNMFLEGAFRSWRNGDTQINLPSPDNDVLIVFTHFIKHFYKEGMTLRQICDWCRLLWTFRGSIDICLLKQRLIEGGLMPEWQSFAALAVNYLGMPVEAMPLYDSNEKWSRKGVRIMEFILDRVTTGKMKTTVKIFRIFPWHTIHFLPSIILYINGLKIRERLFKNNKPQNDN